MPHPPPPEVLALLLAETLHRDPYTRKCYILGTYSLVTTSGFPSKRSVNVYAALTNGHGEQHLMVQIVDADEEREPVVRIERTARFGNPLGVLELPFSQGNVVFPEPGQYQVQLYAEDQLLCQRRLYLELASRKTRDHSE